MQDQNTQSFLKGRDVVFKLMIVEDEKSTRLGLKECVDWDQYEIEVAAEASNGMSALEQLQHFDVDIVLTDIVMPLMDGIELVRQIRQQKIPVKVVFISGYWDMSYLKSAFQMDAVDYVLKPIKLDELMNVMKKVVGICKKEQAEKNVMKDLSKKLAASLPLLREQFITEILLGYIRNKDQIMQRATFLNLSTIKEEMYTVATVQLNYELDMEYSHSETVSGSLEELELQRMGVKEIISSCLKRSYHFFAMTIKESYVSFIIKSPNSITYSEVMVIADQIQKKILNIMNIQVLIGIGEEVSSIVNLNQSFQKSMRSLEQAYFLGDGGVIHFTDINKGNDISVYYPYDIQEKILNAVRLGKAEEISPMLDLLIQELQSNASVSIDYVRISCLELMLLAEKIILENNNNQNQSTRKANQWIKALQMKTMRQVIEWTAQQLKNITKEIDFNQNKRSKSIIECIKEEVNSKYQEGITIQELADKYYFTPNYLSMLFKKETGQTFNEYLTNKRINKAKSLILNSSSKLYEIAKW